MNDRDGNATHDKCPGCDIELTIENIGGYRMYCDKCVKAIPDFPKDGKDHNVKGKYPNFKWVESEV